ncbi:unnamed protein product [Nezara viridula]|uniref:Uncharacterized protein n=1 Tax=Nezara viridula TaxID=85310 RepID=A0A9P0E0Y6_NEZVI|nr:unnamed protein product [Nezara viridula]
MGPKAAPCVAEHVLVVRSTWRGRGRLGNYPTSPKLQGNAIVLHHLSSSSVIESSIILPTLALYSRAIIDQSYRF